MLFKLQLHLDFQALFISIDRMSASMLVHDEKQALDSTLSGVTPSSPLPFIDILNLLQLCHLLTSP